MYTDFLSPSRSLGNFLQLPARSKPARQAKAKTAAPRGVRKQSKIRPKRQRPRRRFLAARGEVRNFTSNTQVMPLPMRTEFIAAVTVANEPNFNCVQYAVNPGNATTFPWLSTISKQFEKYRFNYLEFIYKREVSEYATNGQVGKVMLGFDADASDPAPATKQQLEDTDPHSDGMPCENIVLRIPPRALTRMTDGFYIRTGGLPGASDIKTYDVGNLNIATQGIVNNVEVGELHVRYQVDLITPVLESTTTAPTNNSVAYFVSSAAESSGATTVSTSMLYATSKANGLGIVNTSGSFVPPAGNYLVDATCYSTNSGDVLVVATFDIKKNGTSIFPSGTVPGFADANLVSTNTEGVSVPAFLVANGTDAFTFVATQTYASGTQTQWGSVRWVAI